MNEILGFIVLTSPLFFIVLWVLVCVGLGVFLKKIFSKKNKPSLAIVVGVLVFIFVLTIPIADEITGKIYFKHLCETEAKLNLYQTINLPQEYWDENGTPTFYKNWSDNLGKIFPLVYTKGAYSPLFHIDNAGYKFIDKQSGKILGETVDFRYWGGWVRRNLSPHNTADTCNVSPNLINEIFKPIEQ